MLSVITYITFFEMSILSALRIIGSPKRFNTLAFLAILIEHDALFIHMASMR